MNKREVAYVLDRIADMLMLQDENIYRIRAYRKAADSIYHLEQDIHELWKSNRLTDIPGVGNAVKGQIEELLEKGQCTYYNQLAREVPPGLLEMLSIPGIGHKTVKVIYDKLGIDNIDDLMAAVRERKIRTLPGMGGKTEYTIRKGIELLKERKGKVTLGLALPIAYELIDYLRSWEIVKDASIVGSVARFKPLVKDIDIIVAAHDIDQVREKLSLFRRVKQIGDPEGELIKGELDFNIPFEVIVVNPEEYCIRKLIATGSQLFIRGLLGERINIKELSLKKTEEEIFSGLGLPFIPPELREGQDAIEAARSGKLPRLVLQKELQGDLHVHSEWSDGGHNIQEMAATARSLGYSYIAITDHSKSLSISGGLNEDRLSAQGRIIDELNRDLKDFRILKGIEVDILKDGQLDFEDKILKEMDVVIASVHSHFKLEREQQTQRIIKAIENEHVDIIGHLTGRLLNRREGYDLDINKILLAAAEHKKILEINSHPDRLDVDENIALRAKQMGIKFAINSDAHHRQDLYLVKYGVHNARRGWLEPDDIVNTWGIERLLDYLN
ncbi:MAG: DNA polymerase/3'-5' exonuclease PolX [Syntrophomonadaceae bacterium]|jgi:DNA polymerase (family 10)